LLVVLVHRPAYDDWSFPKGKLEPGEDEATCARREVLEEAGLDVTLGRELGTIEYLDSRARLKTVRYWEMVVSAEAEPRAQHEVDVAEWVPAEEAAERLTYAHDRELLARCLEEDARPEPVPVYLVRHVKAGERRRFAEPDELRGISPSGRKQAQRLVRAFDERPLTRLVSSPFIRCVQTLEPLAEARGIEIDLSRALEEGAGPDRAEELILAVAADGPAALCTHGDVMMQLVDRLRERGVRSLDGGRAFRKGCTWIFEVRDRAIVSLRYEPPPEPEDG
jgi:8-oxo-dGTP diphosphatase